MTKCPTCGAALFKAVPGKTTEEEITDFARHSKLPNRDLILYEKWIHPGEYCPNGCTTILINYGHRELWERFEKDFEETHTCRVTVTGSTTLPLPVSDYKIYIDGNIERTRDKDPKPYSGEFIWLTPGHHRIVVREAEVKKTDRLESNTIWFTASEGTPLNFEAAVVNGHLKLIRR